MAVDNPANPTVTATTPAVTITDPPTITLSGPASAEASAAGAGADVTETVSAPGLTTIYESVITAAGIQETGWQAVSLDASGNGSFTAHLAATGDQIVAVDNPANPTVTATTPAVTITDPPTITLSGPASAEASAAGAGADVTETVSAPGLTTIYESVITAAGIQETGWQAVSLDASGNGSFTAHLAATGDQIVAVDNPANPTVTATTPAVTITDPPTITLSGPASAEASAAGAGADVTETVSAPGLTTIYESVITAAGIQETGWQAVSLDASGNGSFTAHLAATGDQIVAVDNPANPTVTATTPAVTITDPPTITLSGPASAEASAAGAGADVTETVSAPGLTTIYESVITAAGIQETGWQAVSLDASGNGSFTAHLAATGDQIVAVDNPANPTVTATTPAVTITDPPTITLSGPASAEASAAGAGADVTETVSAPGLTTIYESVITAAGIQETGWQAVSLDASGNGSFTAHLAATGDQIVAVDNPANPTVTATTPQSPSLIRQRSHCLARPAPRPPRQAPEPTSPRPSVRQA